VNCSLRRTQMLLCFILRWKLSSKGKFEVHGGRLALSGASVTLAHLQLAQRTNEGSCNSSPSSSSINFPVGGRSRRREKNNIHEPQRQRRKMVCAIIPVLSYFHTIARDLSTPIWIKVLATAWESRMNRDRQPHIQLPKPTTGTHAN
jgi:hypothetical protein